MRCLAPSHGNAPGLQKHAILGDGLHQALVSVQIIRPGLRGDRDSDLIERIVALEDFGKMAGHMCWKIIDFFGRVIDIFQCAYWIIESINE